MKTKNLYVGAAIVALVGLVWFFQGIGLLRGSVMTNESQWAWIGGGMVAASLAFLLFKLRRK